MSLLKRLEEGAEFLLEELKIRAMHHKRDNGHVPDLITEMISHLEKHVVETTPVPADATVEAPTHAVVAAPVEATPTVTVTDATPAKPAPVVDVAPATSVVDTPAVTSDTK